MINVAVVGAAGFVGSQIAKAVEENSKYNLIPVLSSDLIEKMLDAEIIIHSANPAGRYLAEKHPEIDFQASVSKTAKFFKEAGNRRFILISSMSCRTQLYTNYGRNRRACELLVRSGWTSDSTVIRLGPMFGGNRKKDLLHDILTGRKVYISKDSFYAYVDVAWVGEKVVEMIEGPSGIYEIGARNAVRLGDLSAYFHSTSEFCGIDETQIPENFVDGPNATEVYAYAEKELEWLKWQKK
ncbi:MAG TPA: NAD(P)-dependent oxidoreductase [Alphaproteobacteria bacterium]|nr:NAD(P)-dependent oxidoreductase [Alphaproteobacteria bacterium]